MNFINLIRGRLLIYAFIIFFSAIASSCTGNPDPNAPAVAAQFQFDYEDEAGVQTEWKNEAATAQNAFTAVVFDSVVVGEYNHYVLRAFNTKRAGFMEIVFYESPGNVRNGSQYTSYTQTHRMPKAGEFEATFHEGGRTFTTIDGRLNVLKFEYLPNGKPQISGNFDLTLVGGYNQTLSVNDGWFNEILYNKGGS